MVRPVTIALDAMGGDQGAAVCVPAGLNMLRQREELRVVLVGRQQDIDPLLVGANAPLERISVHDAAEIVGMDEHPGDALRKKKDSSMRVAINLVHQGVADACVSAGNTGALMATARFVLKTLPGIDRPAIMAAVPTVEGRAYMLDLGANSDCSHEHLYQFGVMGSVVAQDIEGLESPRIRLLNIGEEDIKGNETVRKAAEILGDSGLNYAGFVEGDAIHRHVADVIVCDGFNGNVALKTMEGTARLIRQYLKEAFGSGLYGRVSGLLAWPVLNRLARRLDPRHYNGASLLGLNGIVIKSHGSADEVAFQQAIHTAMVEVEKGVPDQIRNLLEEH